MRMSGHKGKERTVHQKSHARNPPTQALEQRAGGDHRFPSQFNPIVFVTSKSEQDLIDCLLQKLVPQVVGWHQVITQRFNSASGYQERTSQRLYTLKGTLQWILRCVCHLLLMIASPLLDPINHSLLRNRRSLWEIHRYNALAALLNAPAFHRPNFQLEVLLVVAYERSSDIHTDPVFSGIGRVWIDDDRVLYCRYRSRAATPQASGYGFTELGFPLGTSGHFP